MRLIGCPDTPRQHIGVWLDLFPLPLLFTQTAIPTVRAIMVAAQVGVFETMVAGRRPRSRRRVACAATPGAAASTSSPASTSSATRSAGTRSRDRAASG